MNTKSYLAATLTVGVLVLASPAAQGSGFALPENSAKTMALGSAFTGIADTPAANYHNPAGLANQEGFNVEAGLLFVTPGVTYTGEMPSTGEEVSVDAVRHYFYIPNFHAGYRIHDRVAAGFSFYVPYGLTSEWSKTVSIGGQDEAWWGRGIIQKIGLQTFYFNPSVAVKLHDRVFVGGGLTVVYGTVALQRPVTLSDDPADDIDLKLAGDDLTFGGTAGVLVKALPELLHLGLAFRSGAKFTFQGNAAFTKDGSASNIPAGLRTQLLDGPGEADLALPHVFAFGVGAFPIERLMLTFNFDVIMWSSYDKLEIRFPENPALNTAEPKEWRNTIAIRVGGEYRVLPQLPLRLGFIFDQGPPPAHTVGPELPDGDRYEFCFGAGYELGNFRIDAAYQYLFTGDVEPGPGAPLPGVYQNTAHLAHISLGYKLDI